MKKIITLIILSVVSLGIYSCQKDSSSPVTYTLNGLTNVSLAQGESDQLLLTVSGVGNNQEQVSLDIDGLPAGVGVSFSAKSGTPSFSTTITLTNTSADMGTYNCTLGIKGSKTGVRYYEFTLIITSAAACGLPGTYSYIKTCSGTGGGLDNLIRFSSSSSVRFSNFGGHGWTAFAYVNCATQKIEVPLQSVDSDNQISGTGDFGVDGTINIHYTIENTVMHTKTDCAFGMLRYN